MWNIVRVTTKCRVLTISSVMSTKNCIRVYINQFKQWYYIYMICLATSCARSVMVMVWVRVRVRRLHRRDGVCQWEAACPNALYFDWPEQTGIATQLVKCGSLHCPSVWECTKRMNWWFIYTRAGCMLLRVQFVRDRALEYILFESKTFIVQTPFIASTRKDGSWQIYCEETPLCSILKLLLHLLRHVQQRVTSHKISTEHDMNVWSTHFVTCQLTSQNIMSQTMNSDFVRELTTAYDTWQTWGDDIHCVTIRCMKSHRMLSNRIVVLVASPCCTVTDIYFQAPTSTISLHFHIYSIDIVQFRHSDTRL